MQPYIVYDIDLMETWWTLKPAERDAVLDWLRSYGVHKASRVEVYSDHMLVTTLDKATYEAYRTRRVEITTQPPTIVSGR